MSGEPCSFRVPILLATADKYQYLTNTFSEYLPSKRAYVSDLINAAIDEVRDKSFRLKIHPDSEMTVEILELLESLGPVHGTTQAMEKQFEIVDDAYLKNNACDFYHREMMKSLMKPENVVAVLTIVARALPSRKQAPTDEDSERLKRQKQEAEEIEAGIQAILDGHERLLAGLKRLPPPSEAGKTSYVRGLAQETQPWLKAGRPFGVIGPLVSIYHTVFANFLDLLACPDNRLDLDVLVKTQQLVEASSMFYPNEGMRQHEINRQLSDFLGTNIAPMTLSDQSSNDGLVSVRCPKIDQDAAPVFLEYKAEADRVSTEPCMQAAFGYARYYLKYSKKLLNYCCCPSFTLAITGPTLQVSAVVLVDDMLVQELTLPLLLKDSPLPPQHFLYIARVLNALKVCIPQLCSFYENLEKPVPGSIGHLLPYFTSYKNAEGQDVRLKYVGRVRPKEENSRRALFEAETNQKVKVVVKFIHQYGKRGDELLAKEGLAPALHYFTPLGGGIYVIVMDFVTGDTIFEAKSESLSPDVLTDIERAVNLLHTNDLVFGDLRQPNVMVVKREDGKHGVMLIDFDWCGEHGEARYPIRLNREIDWHSEVVCGGIVAEEHDAYMLSKIRQKFSGR
ncbi:hypothetical protein WOLCODRAFT_167848 [Wolfiporia cocos MD-104 SS10]|uniref:Protein kinase domain-containing protein n=1 Tax=Wolfiporia cocos (strain MD-104) TaxID=742152 RepID=A0A2H3JAD9_WOLCO|nr:hypothetical protein WOLCODRAFT_167848 [Wolfiporia cocos MD-104 SS10]